MPTGQSPLSSPATGTSLIHLYYNALLNDAKPEDLVLRGISLVTFLPGQKAFAFLIPPFQKKNPDWEAVGFAPISENEFDFEWKYTDTAETQFAYTRYRADLQLEAGSNRDAYMAALGTPSLSGPEVPAAYAAFFQECGARIQGLSAGTALHFKVRSRAVPGAAVFPIRLGAGFHPAHPRPGRGWRPLRAPSGRPGAGKAVSRPGADLFPSAAPGGIPLHGFREDGGLLHCLMGRDPVHPGGKSGDRRCQDLPAASLTAAGTAPGWLETFRKWSRSKTTGSSM